MASKSFVSAIKLTVYRYNGYKAENLSGQYYIADIINDRPVYKVYFSKSFFWTSWNYQLDSFWLQLMEKTGFDNEIYLWHHAVNKWRLSKGSSFRDRVKRTIVYINSQGRPGTWIQFQLIFKKTMSSSLEALGMNMFMMNGRKLLRWSYHKFFCSVAKANLFVVIQKI